MHKQRVKNWLSMSQFRRMLRTRDKRW